MQKTTFRQIAFTYCIGTSCFAAFLLPGAVSRYAGTAAVLVPLAAAPFAALLAFMLFRVALRYGSLRAMVRALWGARAARIGAGVVCLWLCAVMAVYLQAFYSRLASTAFSYLPRFVCLSAAALCAGLAVLSPRRAAGRSAAVIFIVLVLTMAALFAFSAEGVHITNFLPVKVSGFTRFLRAFLFPVGSAGLLCFLLYDYEGEAGSLCAYETCLLAGNAVMSAVIFAVQGVFGTALGETIAYPFFALIKSTDSMVKLEHFESLISGIWIVMSLGFFMMVLGRASVLLCSLFPALKPTAKPVVRLLPVGAVFAVALLLPAERFWSEAVLGTWMPLGNILLGILPVSILVILDKIAK
ncbi:MAG: hypothetical protein E7517_07555 [Ruminococcaceae bacterium]|nr:hypothetical protein [Oscillospiraceae bacterium]